MKIEIEPFTIEKKTKYGDVKQDIGQDKVFVTPEGLDRIQAGYVTKGKSPTFLPLSGFPNELSETVTTEVAKLRDDGIEITAADAPSGPDEISSEKLELEDENA